MRKKTVVIIVAIVIIAAVLAGALAFIYFTNRDKTGFLKGTTLNGTDVSGMTPDELSDNEKNWMDSLKVEITENGKEALSGTLKECGFTFDEDAFKSGLEEEEEAQKTNLFIMLRTLTAGDELSAGSAYTIDDDTFKNFVVSSSFKVPRVESKDASLVVNEKTNLYEVAEAVQGNEIDDSKLQSYVKEKIISAINEKSLPDSGTIEVAVPDDVYISKAVSNDTAALEAQIDEKNKELRLEELKKMSITYTFGDKTEVLDGDTISSWATVKDDLSVTVDESKIKEYVSSLASKYNTRYLQRTFTTTGGKTITIDASKNEYGYTIDESSEAAQLKKDILGLKSVTREPCYYSANSYGNPLYYSRSGTDDLNGTYVEVSLTDQHLWFYLNGSLVVESDIVSGCVDDGAQTATGCFPLAYKESPSTLSNAEGSWDVEYWMPFYDGQGLHDADWRSSFGGDIYKSNGSHGCVNLPHDAAATIFKNITAGTAIIIYK